MISVVKVTNVMDKVGVIPVVIVVMARVVVHTDVMEVATDEAVREEITEVRTWIKKL